LPNFNNIIIMGIYSWGYLYIYSHSVSFRSAREIGRTRGSTNRSKWIGFGSRGSFIYK
jgi:hypothetical protein